MEQRLHLLASGRIRSLEIITGKGIHSQGHKAKIKPAVEARLRESPLPYEPVLMGAVVAGFIVSPPTVSGPSTIAMPSQTKGNGGRDGAAGGRPASVFSGVGGLLAWLCSCFGLCGTKSNNCSSFEVVQQQSQRQPARVV